MDSDGASQQQEQRTPEEQGRPKRFSPRWAKEKCKTYSQKACVGTKEWLKRPWWFQEKEPLAKFTGWVAAYTGVLVIVSALQFCTLQSTDRTTRDALIAANRAWISPNLVSIGSLVKGKGFDVTVQYQNSGRQPALNVLGAHIIATFSKKEWEDSTARDKIISNANACFTIKKLSERTQVAYPSTGLTGSGYTLRFNTTEDTEQTKITFDDALESGRGFFVTQWCFSYMSINEVHHSTSCHFYNAKDITGPVLPYCTVGNDAD